MLQQFERHIRGEKIRFYQFYNYRRELRYLLVWKADKAEELILVAAPDDTGTWEFVYPRVPVTLLNAVAQIDYLIKVNESSLSGSALNHKYSVNNN